MEEDERYELLEGERFIIPTPPLIHQLVLGEILFLLHDFVKAHRLGQVLMAPLEVVLSIENIVQPDVFFISNQRRHIVDPDGCVNAAPDLVIEILSPSTSGRDRLYKRKLYSKFGVQEYWIVDPAARTIEVLVPSPAGLEVWRTFDDTSDLVSPLLSDLTFKVRTVLDD